MSEITEVRPNTIAIAIPNGEIRIKLNDETSVIDAEYLRIAQKEIEFYIENRETLLGLSQQRTKIRSSLARGED
jgi:hypothetical protein